MASTTTNSPAAPRPGAARPTVAVLSLRSLRRVPWMTTAYSMERLLAEAFDAPVSTFEAPGRGIRAAARNNHKLRRLVRTVGVKPWTIAPRRPGPPADVVFVVVNGVEDLAILWALLPQWPELGRTRVLVQFELWPRDLADSATIVEPVLRAFDRVFTTCSVTRSLLADGRLGPVDEIAPAADVTAYPPAADADRPIAVINYGRRSPDQHRLLRAWAAQAGRWYHFDTAKVDAITELDDHQWVLGQLLGHAAFSVCNFARFTEPWRIGPAREAGARFYESLAAGAALLGDLPTTGTFADHFGHLPGVVAFPVGASELPDRFHQLQRDPGALRRLSVVHQSEALQRHDVAHRLQHLLDAVELPVPAPILDRIGRLRDRAAALSSPSG
jgi:hypothetical protein